MSPAWTEGICNQSAGFLFKHECGFLSTNYCAVCLKPICEAHTREVDGRMLCPSCAQITANRNDDSTDYDHRQQDSYYSPGTYYTGYGYHGAGAGFHSHPAHGSRDPNDLHPGDAESLKHEGDEDFEGDLGES